jgi:hypothetical protein
MRSGLVFSAERKVRGEFLLASLLIKAVKELHQPYTRLEDTVNEAFGVVAKGEKTPPKQ